MLAWVVTQQDLAAWARINILAVAPYPLMIIGLVVFDGVATSGGKVLALIDGAIVAMLAVGQARLVGRSGRDLG